MARAPRRRSLKLGFPTPHFSAAGSARRAAVLAGHFFSCDICRTLIFVEHRAGREELYYQLYFSALLSAAGRIGSAGGAARARNVFPAIRIFSPGRWEFFPWCWFFRH
jgi:hypothetical protein